MEGLLSPSERKELQLFQLTIQSDDFVSINQLKELLHSSISNVWRIVNKLAETYPNYVELIKHKQLGIKFVELDSSQDTYLLIRSDYLKRNMNFILLDALFHEEFDSVQEFCENYYISVGAFYKKKKELDTMLEQNKLIIDTKNFRIYSHNDLYVRDFFYYVYWETFKTVEWPFKLIDKPELTSVLFTFLSNHTIELNTLEKEQVLYRFAIMFTRVRKRHFFNKSILNKLIPPELSAFLSKLNDWLMNYIPKEQIEDEVFYLSFLIISNYSSAYINLPISEHYLASYFGSIDSIEWQLTINFFEQLRIVFPDQQLELENNVHELVHIMHIHVYSTFFDHSYIPSSIPHYLEEISSLSQDAAMKIIETIDLAKHPQNTNYLKYYYSLFIESYFTFKKVNIALDMSSDRMSANRIKNRLLTIFKDNISFVDHLDCDSESINLVISDTSVYSTSKVFIIKHPYSEKSFKLLKDYIMEVFFKLNK